MGVEGIGIWDWVLEYWSTGLSYPLFAGSQASKGKVVGNTNGNGKGGMGVGVGWGVMGLLFAIILKSIIKFKCIGPNSKSTKG